MNDIKMNNCWLQTHTGKKFFPLDPKIEDIDIEDIAHSLSMLCRFTGHSTFFYSVSQHSVLVSYNCNPEDALMGLLHDASEYALQDIPSPLKRSGKFEEYRIYEYKLQSMIYTKFCKSIIEPPSVKEADIRMLATEARDLMSPLHPEWIQPAKPYDFKIDPVLPHLAKSLFINRFNELTKRKI